MSDELMPEGVSTESDADEVVADILTDAEACLLYTSRCV